MKLPKKDSRRYKIIMLLTGSTGMTAEQFVEKYTLMGIKTMRDFKNEMYDLRKSGYLNRVGDIYFSTIEPDKPVSTKGEIVPPRTVKEFTEISKKYLTSKVSPRGQPLRELQFINLGASIVEPNRF